MLLNYIRLSFRLLARNPFFTFINVAGLSVGFAVFFILWQYSQNELKSDQFHKDYERIYRLYFDFYHYTGVDWTSYLSGTVPPVFTSIAREKFTEIESATRIFNQKNFDEIRWAGTQSDTSHWLEMDVNVVFSHVDKGDQRHSFLEENAAYADPNLFGFFSIPLIKGLAGDVLQSADAIVLSASTAKKYFGEDDPIGKTLILNDSASFTVTGVFQDLPKNTHLTFDLVMSTLRIQHAIENVNPFQRSAQNYLKVREGVSVFTLEKKIDEEQKKHWDFTSWGGSESKLTLALQPLAEVPFRIFDNDVFVQKSKYVLLAFRAVSLIVLIMALINYLNLKLATQTKRMKELATRKTAGARQLDFIIQFLIESVIINVLAVLISLTFIQLMKSPLELSFQFYLPGWNEVQPAFFIVFGSMTIITIMVAGLHPALSVWRMTTRNILGQSKMPKEKIGFVQVSTVLQFVSALTLIVWMFSVINQIDYVIDDSWGLDSDRVVVVDMPVFEDNDISVEINSLKNELLATSGIENVALSAHVAGDLAENGMGYRRTDTTELFVVSKSDGGVDERYIPFYGLKMLAGRNFIKDNPADKNSVILSRLSAQSVGYDPEEAIGKIVRVAKYPWRPFEQEAEIIGVFEDHRTSPLLEAGFANANRGTILIYGNTLFPKNKPAKLSVRLNAVNPESIINNIEKKYHQLFPQNLFHWYFLNDHMNVHYQNEKIARNQITLFTCIAIGIACLGLLGMISNKVVEKTKRDWHTQSDGRTTFSDCPDIALHHGEANCHCNHHWDTDCLLSDRTILREIFRAYCFAMVALWVACNDFDHDHVRHHFFRVVESGEE